jgi:hypothetical protein
MMIIRGDGLGGFTEAALGRSVIVVLLLGHGLLCCIVSVVFWDATVRIKI